MHFVVGRQLNAAYTNSERLWLKPLASAERLVAKAGGSRTLKFRLSIANCQLPIVNCQLQIANCQLSVENGERL
jgi:hypothetical protein